MDARGRVVGELLADVDDETLSAVVVDLNAAAADAVSGRVPGVQAVYRTLAALLAEHQAERRADPLWALRYPPAAELPPLDGPSR